MSILKSNSISIDQQPIDEEWLKHCGIHRCIINNPVEYRYVYDLYEEDQLNMMKRYVNLPTYDTIYNIFRIHVYINKDGKIYLVTSHTNYRGLEFAGETLLTKGDVLRFLNTINVIIGDQS